MKLWQVLRHSNNLMAIRKPLSRAFQIYRSNKKRKRVSESRNELKSNSIWNLFFTQRRLQFSDNRLKVLFADCTFFSLPGSSKIKLHIGNNVAQQRSLSILNIVFLHNLTLNYFSKIKLSFKVRLSTQPLKNTQTFSCNTYIFTLFKKKTLK